MIPAGCESRCRGCSQRELSRERSLAAKREFVEDRFRAEGLGTAIEAVRGREEPGRWGYREKSVLHAEPAPEGSATRWRLGLLVPSSAGGIRDPEILEIPACPVHSERLNAGMRELGRSFPEDWPLRFAVASGRQLTVVVKLAEPVNVSALERWAAEWARARAGEWDGVWACFHPAAGHRVLSAKGWRLLWGERRSGEPGERYGPASFQQLLPDLYGEALRAARRHLAGCGAIVDLCTGTGRSLGGWGAPALGVELSGEAVECARENAPGFAVLRGKCSERLPQIREWIAERAGAWGVFANPPRPGLEPEVVDWIASEARISRVAYLSCSPATLARDARRLTERGFGIERIAPFDFFPQTHHVETLALLSRPGRPR